MKPSESDLSHQHAQWSDRFVWHSAGAGLLCFASGQGVGVDWQLVQTRAGRLFVLVLANESTKLGKDYLHTMYRLDKPPTHLVSDDGGEWATRVRLRAWEDNVHAAAADAGWLTISAADAERARNGGVAIAFRFSISNLAPDDPPAAEWQQGETKLVWRPVDEYERAVSTLRSIHRTAFTATLTVESHDRVHAADIADVACDLASYACGCRVQWLHLEGLGADGTPVSAYLPNPITGPYVALPLISGSSIWEFMREQWEPYAAFRNDDKSKARRLLGLLLNATADDDFIELRGAKLAATVDAIVTMTLGAKPAANMFRSSNACKRFLGSLRNVIRTDAMSYLSDHLTVDEKDATAEEFAGKVRDLIRPSLSKAIEKTSRLLDIYWGQNEIGRFVLSRNELVHESRFVCQRIPPPTDWPIHEPDKEYFWMLRFVDRMVLRTIHYRGPFLDRCLRNGSIVQSDPANQSGE